MAEKDRGGIGVAGRSIRGKWLDATELAPILADQLHVARVNELFYLTFGQLRLPMENGVAQAPVYPIAKIGLTKAALGRMIVVLQKALNEEEQE